MSIIIGIDHGYYAIKTAHCSFPAGLTSYGEHEPYRQMAEVRALTDGQWTYPTYQAWRNGGKIIRQFKQSGNGVLFAAGSC